MADYIAAQITIGGKIPADLAPALCQAIVQERLSLEWGDCIFEPSAAEDLLEARTSIDQVEVLRLYDDDAAWGEFRELEAFLQEHAIPFDRFHEGKYEIDPCLRQFRPADGCRDFRATSLGAVVVLLRDLQTVRDDVAAASEHLAAGKYQPAAQKLQTALTALAEQLIEPIPLPALEITSLVDA